MDSANAANAAKAVTVAMSGGVDSGATALLLRDQGYACRGITFDMNGTDDGAGAAAVCRALGIPHSVEDATDVFTRLVRDPFARIYAAGETPNPCVICNRDVKFPLLTRAAGDGYSATGHYARLGKCGDSVYIKKGADPLKDQSYMLWALSDGDVGRLILPLGDLTKDEVREIAREAALPCHASPDSQDICFIPDGDLRRYLDGALGKSPEGDFVDADGRVLGRHSGQRNFTIGQSRGLGIALGRRMYVLGKDAAANLVTLGDEGGLYRREVRGRGLRLWGDLGGKARLSVKLRYTRHESVATVWQSGEDEITARFDEPVRAPAPGQSMVMYDGDALVAGAFLWLGCG